MALPSYQADPFIREPLQAPLELIGEQVAILFAL